MHWKVYQHRVVQQASDLYMQVFEAVGDNIKIQAYSYPGKSRSLLEAHEDVDVFVNLNDGILNTIQTRLSANHEANKKLKQIHNQVFRKYKYIEKFV